ncbi:SET domain-containing protein [Fusarium denticulatum]|uniref:SET domain-containing protein n=1 Tax=Fusarium denticulatum TaxID=48507 RepID=A0A8H5UG00_9HYPO|nr:SET domain-containing protein [Fusarium denticulatum]
MVSKSTLPIDIFPTWARLNDVEFTNAKLQETDGKGIGLVATNNLTASVETRGVEGEEDKPEPEGQVCNSDGEKDERARVETHGHANNHLRKILQVPHDLILSTASIEEYSKVDQNFRQLLDSAGHQFALVSKRAPTTADCSSSKSTRADIMLYLLAHLVLSSRDTSSPRDLVPTPWTEYLKFLPRDIPVPTMWSELERALLQGTSLEAALDAKLSTLNKEFDELIERSSTLPFWNSFFWEREAVTIDDWVLVDAWYRSRCLELPRSGYAMVPVLDMANHSHSQTAYYDEDDEDNIVLLSRPGLEISIGDEVNISYGEKSPAEMIFSYGFVDHESTVEELTLPLELLADDPLGKAKLHIFRGLPTIKLSRSKGKISWQCPFVYLMCLNEEDGLEFRVLQGTNGDRELRLFWQGEDATTRADDFGDLIKDHPLCQIFRLRAVSVLYEVVTDHLMQLSSEISHDELEPLHRAGQIRDGRLQLAQKLRETEASVLESAAVALDEQAKQHLKQTLPQIPRKLPQVLECQGTFSAFLAY